MTQRRTISYPLVLCFSPGATSVILAEEIVEDWLVLTTFHALTG